MIGTLFGFELSTSLTRPNQLTYYRKEKLLKSPSKHGTENGQHNVTYLLLTCDLAAVFQICRLKSVQHIYTYKCLCFAPKQVLCAKNLAKKDLFRLPDPFAKVSVEGSGQCHTTDTYKSSLDPKWNQHFDLYVV